MTAIADVAVRKRHQRQDEILIFFTRTILESASCFSVGNVRIFNKRMLCETRVFIASAQAYAVRTGLREVSELFWKQLLDEVRVKIILILSSRWWRFVISNICYFAKGRKIAQMQSPRDHSFNLETWILIEYINRLSHTEIGKFRNIQCVNHGVKLRQSALRDFASRRCVIHKSCTNTHHVHAYFILHVFFLCFLSENFNMKRSIVHWLVKRFSKTIKEFYCNWIDWFFNIRGSKRMCPACLICATRRRNSVVHTCAITVL